MPYLQSETYGSGDQTWLASAHGIRNGETMTLKISEFTKTTHYPDGYVPSGTPVNIADPGAVIPWSDTAEAELGFVLFDLPVHGDNDIVGSILVHGIVHANRVPGPFTKPATGSAAGFTFVKGEDN